MRVTIDIPEKWSDLIAVTCVGGIHSNNVFAISASASLRQGTHILFDEQGHLFQGEDADSLRALKNIKKEGDKIMEKLKVSATTKPGAAAGAIAGILRKDKALEVQAIGAAAVNQTVKAIAVARGFVAANGLDLTCRPAFVELTREGKETTAIKITVEATEA